MNAEQWRQIRPILESALELPPASRKSFLDKACVNAAVRSEIDSLLLSHDEANSDFLNPASPPILNDEEDELRFRLPPGKRIGAYEILEEIAQGGMGAVYRAVRADGQYKQQVALKIVRSELGAELAATRFRNERQILATLDHVNIAKILDGGTTQDRLPYFVMELIDGLPITDYCDQHKLPINERLQLFRTVCAAVHHAHQRLVIHRDIKPTNILITSEGALKLLDFGIAKIFGPTHMVENVTLSGGAAWLMTPEYASPEQLRGEVVTTATDVYSLGLLLYELLTGHRAYRFPSHMLHAIAKAVLEAEPEKPSTAIHRAEEGGGCGGKLVLTAEQVGDLRGDSPEKLRRRLIGDLDNIVMKAIRKEPRERYASVDQFSEDIRLHLNSLPVLARKATAAYRFRKYLLRHKIGVAAAALVFLSLVTGIALTAREARVARANQVRAEQRFNDVRKLANSLIFEIHDSVQNLPGATPTRKLILDRALQYLDSLANESREDASLQRELASAYMRVATLQGIASEPNLGQGEAGLISFGKALTIREAVARSNPTNAKDQLDLAAAHRLLARMLATAGKTGAADQNEQALAITATLLNLHQNDSDVLRERAVELELAGDMQDDPAVAVEAYRKSLAITNELAKAYPEEKSLRHGIAMVSSNMGSELAQLGSRTEALELSRSALDILESLAQDQTNARYRRELAVALVFRAGILLGNGDSLTAYEADQRALGILEPMAKGDPQNMILQLDLAGVRSSLGIALAQQGRYREGEAMLGTAIQLYQESLARNHADTEIPWLLGHTQIWMGEALARQAKTAAAAQSYRKSIATLEALQGSASNPSVQSDLAAAHLQLGKTLAKTSDASTASPEYRTALVIAEPLASVSPPNIAALYTEADAYFGMGELAKKDHSDLPAKVDKQRPRMIEACEWYRKSAEVWRKIPNPGAVSSSIKPCGSPQRVAQELAECRAVTTILGTPTD